MNNTLFEFAYLCNKDPEKKQKCLNDGFDCDLCSHTLDPRYAKNPESVELASKILNTFESNYATLKLFEVEKKVK